jgi:hypothetical protein
MDHYWGRIYHRIKQRANDGTYPLDVIGYVQLDVATGACMCTNLVLTDTEH